MVADNFRLKKKNLVQFDIKFKLRTEQNCKHLNIFCLAIFLKIKYVT